MLLKVMFKKEEKSNDLEPEQLIIKLNLTYPLEERKHPLEERKH